MESLISAFPFIVQDGPIQSRQPVRSTFVRAHVMERYHRERRTKKGLRKTGLEVKPHQFVVPQIQWQEVKGVEAAKKSVLEPQVSIDPKTRKGKKSLGDCNHTQPKVPVRKTHFQHTVVEHPGLYSLSLKDPVRQDSARFLQIITTYSRVPNSRSTPFDVMNRVWLPAAFSDPALFSASFSNFSSHVIALCDADEERDVPASLQHKGFALRQIAKKIEVTTNDAPTDLMIACVLCLVGSELLNEDPAALNIHLKGIRQMIAARGGPELLGFNGVLKRLYLTYELLFSTVFKEHSPPSPKGSPQLHSSNPLPYSAQHGIFTLGRTAIDPVSQKFCKNTVRLLSALCDHLSSSDVFIVPPDHDCHDRSPTENLSELLIELDHLSSTSEDHVLQSIILATTIQYPHLNPFSQTSLPRKIKQLEQHLTQTSMLSFWKPLPGALLWCLVVGVSASEGLPERLWFMASLSKITTGLAFENWEGVRRTLEKFGAVVADEKIEEADE